MQNTPWKWGQQAALAKLAGISRQRLSDILHRRKEADNDLAFRLSFCSAAILGKDEQIPWVAFADSKTTNNIYFKN